jgi:hypothetical protein
MVKRLPRISALLKPLIPLFRRYGSMAMRGKYIGVHPAFIL